MQAKPFKILVVIALTLIVLTAIVVHADIFLYSYSERYGKHSKVWAAIWGTARTDEQDCMTGELYGVDGVGGGWIDDGYIVVYREIIDPTPYGTFAYKITRSYLWDGTFDAEAIASIGAVKGACGPYYPT